jgi:hypothetical protein
VTLPNIQSDTTAAQAHRIREQLPAGGLFAGQDWRIAPAPFSLGEAMTKELDSLGRVLLQFYRAVNLLYRKSVEGKQPAWVAALLDQGKPADLIALQRSTAFKQDVPRVLRPDLLLTDDGFRITELDSVPGGIGLTSWLNKVYCGLRIADCGLASRSGQSEIRNLKSEIIGGGRGMLDGFTSIFGDAPRVHIVVSEEAATYRPEMEWLASQLGPRFTVHDSRFTDFADGDAVYRFFELFDLVNVPNSTRIFELADAGKIRVTPPPKPVFEEKMLFALLWNRNLRDFWRQELGESFLNRLLKLAPYSWVIDPSPLPPHAAIPEINLTDWRQLKALSQKERDLILKVSGFSPHAWGARGVFLGSDLSQADWAAAVDGALANFALSPFVLQRYHKPALMDASWFDFERNEVVTMKGRTRLCPYYFVSGDREAARATLGGVLATICPADKKIIHGMKDAILAPCCL